MSTRKCCTGQERHGHNNIGATVPRAGLETGSAIRRCVEFARWVIPSLTLALIPKCPLCLAGYIAIGTGIGISFTAATYLRIFLMVVSVGAILYFLVKRLHRFISFYMFIGDEPLLCGNGPGHRQAKQPDNPVVAGAVKKCKC